MNTALLVARCGLAVVFAAAAAAKLANIADTREALADFGLPQRLVPPAAIALPLAELGAAVLLVPTATARVGALIALVLLVTFTAVIARSLIRGERPDCNCFGRRSAAIGPATLGRNAALSALAASVAVAGPGEGLGAALDGMPAWSIVLGLALVIEAWFGWQLFRQNGRLIARVQALEERLDAGRPLAPADDHSAARLELVRRGPRRRQALEG